MGRLSVVAHEASDVKGKDKRTNAYLKFRIGGAQNGTWKRTKTVKNATTEPDFADEKIDFDITDGNLICQDNDTTLEVALYDDNFPFDALLGTATIKCRKFIESPSTAFKDTHQLHVYKFGKGFTLTAKVKLSLKFERGFAGISVFTMVDGRNLANRGGVMDKQDP
jgi:hypothetical protein